MPVFCNHGSKAGKIINAIKITNTQRIMRAFLLF
jgi:hypothetical protein